MITIEAEKIEKNNDELARSAYTSGYYTDEKEKQPHQSDPLKQLSANIQCLEDLQGRLSFMIKEIKTLKS